MLQQLLVQTLEDSRRELATGFLGAERRYLDTLELQGLEKSTLTLIAREKAPSEDCRARVLRALTEGYQRALRVEVRVRIVAAATPIEDPDLLDPIVDPGNETAAKLLDHWVGGGADQVKLAFLYGPEGCGKSHLLRCFVRKSREPVWCWNALEFQAAVASTLRAGDFLTFKRALLGARVLVFDEVHRLRGKRRTQEELTLLFDEWRALGVRLLFAGRHNPRDIEDLAGALGSRFLGGFTIGLEQPGVEARVELLRRHGYTEDRARRELPGALAPGRSYAEVLRLIGQSRGDRPIGAERTLCVDDCLCRVARAFGVQVEELEKGGSSRRISVPRQVSAYLLVRRGSSLVSLARRLGWRSASSVSYAIQRIQRRMAEDRDFQKLVEGLDAR